MKALKEKMAPSKKIAKKPTGKKESRLKYVEDKEEYDRKKNLDSRNMLKQAAGIGEALMKAKMGYSDKPRVKPQKKTGGY